jgi:CDP-diacylglycerol--glycerol-3-phosphate 3-phosphatidyltransferase
MIPGWIAILIVSREFAVNGLRAIAAAEGYTIKASDLGKTKMVSQVAAIAMMLVAIRLPEWRAPAMWMMYGVVVFGVVSALQYFAKFWSKVDHRTKARRRRELLLMERRQRRAAKAQASAAEKVGPPTVHG